MRVRLSGGSTFRRLRMWSAAACWGGRAGSKVSRNECTVDPKQICLRKLDLREIALYDNGVIKRDTHSLDQSERHLTILTDYRNPNGEPLALVNCQFDMRTHAVTRADLTNGKTPADDRAEGYVCVQGLCL